MKNSVFSDYPLKYDRWYDNNRDLYWPEMLALKRVVKKEEFGLEIGIGTGRFTMPLGVNIGIDPSYEALQIAQTRGVEVIEGIGEDIPFECDTFDYVLMVTTVCFLENPKKTFKESKRVLRKKGKLVIGMIPKRSDLGKIHLENKETSLFFKDVIFYSTKEITRYLKSAGFNKFQFLQTLINYPKEKEYFRYSKIQNEYDRGSFIVITAKI
ncbi:MAG: methyltransferase domain-containing protein [Proteobacteria bacterium]|nr:methyltransferase domain-containing protein [Pseudomonadota bacterium]